MTDIECASRALYEAETALHTARQTGVDPWIRAAADRLHEAILRYELARATAQGSDQLLHVAV